MAGWRAGKRRDGAVRRPHAPHRSGAQASRRRCMLAQLTASTKSRAYICDHDGGGGVPELACLREREERGGGRARRRRARAGAGVSGEAGAQASRLGSADAASAAYEIGANALRSTFEGVLPVPKIARPAI